MLVFEASGDDELFKNETGGHRWQRVPPTEKRGRVQTSTITVAVVKKITELQLYIDPNDLEWKTCRGSGPGGQHRNKTESAVQLTHLPTKVSVRCESERSQHRNRESALDILRAKLYDAQTQKINNAAASERKQQVGSGMRGDKRRTIRVQDGQVNDHITGKKWALKQYLRGDW